MEYNCQSLHRLPVVNYDVTYNNKHDSKPISRRIVCNSNVTSNMQINDCSHRKIYFKAKDSKHLLQRNSNSLKNIKESFSVCNKYLKELIRPTNQTSSSRKSEKKRSRTPSHPNNEINVLFSSESRKSRSNYKNRNRNRNRKSRKEEISRNLMNDIYNFSASNYHVCLGDTSNKIAVDSKEHQNVKYVYKNSDVSKGKCLFGISSNNITAQYKVVNFPNYDQTDTELEAINMGRSHDFNPELCNFQSLSNKEANLSRDKEEAVSTLCSSAQNGGGDACTISVQCTALKENPIKCEKVDGKSKSNFDVFNPFIIQENATCLVKITLKYLIFGLVLLVWSPCIITLYFFWLITYPLRPKHMSRIVARNSTCRRNSQDMDDNAMETGASNFWSSLVKSISWAYHPIATSFTIFKSLLTSDKNNLSCNRHPTHDRPGKKSCVMASDPKKKYTLYYSRSKGWLMKSQKLRPKKMNNIRCNLTNLNLKNAQNISYTPHCVKRIRDTNPHDMPRQPLHRCRGHAKKYMVVTNKKSCFSHYKNDRHKHLYPDTSGLPVHIELSNPRLKRNFSSKIRGNIRPSTKTCKSFSQRPLSTIARRHSNYPHCHAIGWKLLEQKPSLKLKNKIWRSCKKTKCKIKSCLCNTDPEVFEDDPDCRDIYIRTLRRRPWFWIYRKCPSFYPIFIGIYKFYENVFHFLLLLSAACIWCPLLACFYMWYLILCRCV